MADTGEPRLKPIRTHLSQLVDESQRDIPVTLPDGTIRIEAVLDLQSTIDDLTARIVALENP